MTAFCVQKFRHLLWSCVGLYIVSFLLEFTGNILSGHYLGESALAGVSLGMPVFSIGLFLISLLGAGTGINYSLRRGRCDKEGATTVFMQGLWTVLAVGLLSALVVYFLREPYIAFIGPDATTAEFARAYWRYLPPLLVVMPLSGLLVNCCTCDGESRYCLYAYLAQFAFTVAFSWIGLCAGFGVAACSAGLLAGQVLLVLILAGHFRQPTNTFTFAWRFRLSDSFRIVRSSFGDASSFLGGVVVLVVLAHVVCSRFGSVSLVVVPAYSAIGEFSEYASGFAAALQPIVPVYFGEGNHVAIRTVSRDCFRLLFAIALAVTAVEMLWPSLVLSAIGIDNPDIVPQAETVVRLTAGGMLPSLLLNVYNNYCQFIEREDLAIGLTWYYWVVLPILTLFAFSGIESMSFWSWSPVWRWGGAALFAGFLLWRYGRSRFPLLLDREREAGIAVLDLKLGEMEIAAAAETVWNRLIAFGVDRGRATRARLIVEETLMVVKDRNAPRPVNAEVSLDLNDGVKLTLRDDGEIFDITDSDARVADLRSYLVASMMERHNDKANLLTTGFNRNVFRL